MKSNISTVKDELVLKLVESKGSIKLLRNTDSVIVRVYCIVASDIIAFEVLYPGNKISKNINDAAMITANFRNCLFTWTAEDSSFSSLLELLQSSDFQIDEIDTMKERIKSQIVENFDNILRS